MGFNPSWPGGKVLAALPFNAYCMTLDEIVEATGLPSTHITHLIAAMKAQGLIIAMEECCYARTPAGDAVIRSGLPRKSGAKKGVPRPRRAMPNTLNARIWRAMRVMRRATFAQLLEIAGFEGDDSIRGRRYVTALVAHGLVTVSGRGAPRTNGRGGLPARQYILIRDIGPQAPVWQEKTRILYDPNTLADLPTPEAETPNG